MKEIRATQDGIEHCGMMRHWKNLDYRIEDGLWVWTCPTCRTDLRSDDFSPVTPFIDESLSILFGRGIWDINGQTVAIEVPGWYEKIEGRWVYSKNQER